MGFLDRLLNRSAPIPVPASTVVNPVLGLWNLQGSVSDQWRSEDRAALSPLFSRTIESDGGCPTCDVLVLYCRISPRGHVDGLTSSFTDAARGAGARILIVASENDAACYRAARNGTLNGVNLVMTIDRRGEHFPRFFRCLFDQMKHGVPMPVAWHNLAPQSPEEQHIECPGTIFACGAGGVRFAEA